MARKQTRSRNTRKHTARKQSRCISRTCGKTFDASAPEHRTKLRSFWQRYCPDCRTKGNAGAASIVNTPATPKVGDKLKDGTWAGPVNGKPRQFHATLDAALAVAMADGQSDITVTQAIEYARRFPLVDNQGTPHELYREIYDDYPCDQHDNDDPSGMCFTTVVAGDWDDENETAEEFIRDGMHNVYQVWRNDQYKPDADATPAHPSTDPDRNPNNNVLVNVASVCSVVNRMGGLVEGVTIHPNQLEAARYIHKQLAADMVDTESGSDCRIGIQALEDLEAAIEDGNADAALACISSAQAEMTGPDDSRWDVYAAEYVSSEQSSEAPLPSSYCALCSAIVPLTYSRTANQSGVGECPEGHLVDTNDPRVIADTRKAETSGAPMPTTRYKVRITHYVTTAYSQVGYIDANSVEEAQHNARMALGFTPASMDDEEARDEYGAEMGRVANPTTTDVDILGSAPLPPQRKQ